MQIFSAEIEQLHAMLQWIREKLDHIGLDASSIRKMEIASEEAIVNVIQHAALGKLGKIELEIRHVHGCQIEITIRDSGPPFDPLEQHVVFDKDSPLEERKIGGLGILFIRQYVDEVRYKREKNKNILILVKKIPF